MPNIAAVPTGKVEARFGSLIAALEEEVADGINVLEEVDTSLDPLRLGVFDIPTLWLRPRAGAAVDGCGRDRERLEKKGTEGR